MHRSKRTRLLAAKCCLLPGGGGGGTASPAARRAGVARPRLRVCMACLCDLLLTHACVRCLTAGVDCSRLLRARRMGPV